jgi:drug/metabolite transporter (DMT)-like permease
VRNRGIGRARMFVGGFLLAAAVITWGTAFMMSPHGSEVAAGTEHVRTTVVTFLRNSAIGTLVLAAIAGWLLFPARRPRWPARDYAIMAVLGLLVATSIYQLVWIRTLTAS